MVDVRAPKCAPSPSACTVLLTRGNQPLLLPHACILRVPFLPACLPSSGAPNLRVSTATCPSTGAARRRHPLRLLHLRVFLPTYVV